MTELCLPLITARRQRPNNDGGGCRPYVDSFLDLRVPDDGDTGSKDSGRRALTDDEMVNLVVEFLGAGAGTVAACLEWTLAHLVSQPEAQEKLRRELDGEASAGSPNRTQLIRGMPYMHAVILEILRIHPPAPFAQRHVQAGVLVRGAAAPAGSDVFVLFVLGDIGRHSKTWKDPDEFRPERFLAGGEAEGVGPLPGPKETRMMPFGAGHRFCPGVGLAMGIIKCFLAALVREFEWAPPSDAVVDLTELDGFLKTMKMPLSARLTRRT
jgi:cytochrome P450